MQVRSVFRLSPDDDTFCENLPDSDPEFRSIIRAMTPFLAATSQDFTRPLELLRASHARISRQCDALRRLAANIKKRGCSSAARRTSLDVIRKLDVVTYHHKEDEEQDLLPRMVASATKGRGSSLTNMVADITSEHRVLQDRKSTRLNSSHSSVSRMPSSA